MVEADTRPAVRFARVSAGLSGVSVANLPETLSLHDHSRRKRPSDAARVHRHGVVKHDETTVNGARRSHRADGRNVRIPASQPWEWTSALEALLPVC